MSYRRGHVKGTKKEQKGSQDWYWKIQQEHLERIEREEQAKQQQSQPKQRP